MVETRQQEKSMLEQVQEMHLQQEGHSDELRQRTDSLNARFSKLETALFTFFQQGPAAGKQTIREAIGSPTMGPLSPASNHPPDPPDLHGFSPHREPQPPMMHNGFTGRLTKVGFPTFDGTDLRDWICQCEQFFDLDSTTPELKVRLAAMHLRFNGTATSWRSVLDFSHHGLTM